jgi:Domain of unknown function (DUF4276)
MPRLLVHVEGQTEETFVGDVLREHLAQFGYSSVNARLVGNPRLRDRRGGIRSWEAVRRDILRHLKEDAGAVATTMVDYYALPQEWPGRTEATKKLSTSEKAEYVEAALLADIAEAMGPQFDASRFVPLVMMHEFEALLFSDPERFAQEIGKGNLSTKFRSIREEFESPKDIDDSPETAPSKRIERLFPGYEKPLFGVLAAMGIGLATIRRECPHFNDWLNRLEALPKLLSPQSRWKRSS